mmetsp:Transcript_25421/g.84080  ORF Transcript_25421/g.84080 Transcript_25421/m.84080 type:complete len:266 (-) Transcript_25421:988-1785(-)
MTSPAVLELQEVLEGGEASLRPVPSLHVQPDLLEPVQEVVILEAPPPKPVWISVCQPILVGGHQDRSSSRVDASEKVPGTSQRRLEVEVEGRGEGDVVHVLQDEELRPRGLCEQEANIEQRPSVERSTVLLLHGPEGVGDPGEEQEREAVCELLQALLSVPDGNDDAEVDAAVCFSLLCSIVELRRRQQRPLRFSFRPLVHHAPFAAGSDSLATLSMLAAESRKGLGEIEGCRFVGRQLVASPHPVEHDEHVAAALARGRKRVHG